jgi:hypothetical protein
MSADDFLFFNDPAHYYIEWEEWWDPDEPKKPIIFSRTGKKALYPNNNIQYQES